MSQKQTLFFICKNKQKVNSAIMEILESQHSKIWYVMLHRGWELLDVLEKRSNLIYPVKSHSLSVT